jgi:hypothetical protein
MGAGRLPSVLLADRSGPATAAASSAPTRVVRRPHSRNLPAWSRRSGFAQPDVWARIGGSPDELGGFRADVKGIFRDDD